MKNWQKAVLFIALPLVLIVSMWAMVNTSRQVEKVKYSEIVSYFHEDKISEFSLNIGSGELKY